MSAIQDIAEDYKVKAALAAFNWQTDDIVQLAIEVQQIPSPTGAEAEVAAFIEQRLGETGLSDIHQDSLYNTFARLPGEESHLPLVLSAHTDTVFPLGTDLSVRFGPNSHADSQLISGPGLADNALGVAGLIWLAQIISATGFVTKRDIWFVANVGEEGLGNLCGMRRVVDRFGDQAAYIVVEGGSLSI